MALEPPRLFLPCNEYNNIFITLGFTIFIVVLCYISINLCDRILVIDGGVIAEEGTYDELIAKDGFFAELVKRQRTDDN